MMLAIVVIIISCSKKEGNNNPPVEKKKCAWVAGWEDSTGYGMIIYSADAGETWVRQGEGQAQLQGIWAINSQRIFVVGGVGGDTDDERGFVSHTIDGGVTWDSIVPANDYNRHEWIGVVSNGNTVVIYGGASHYMASTDEGETWRYDSILGMSGGTRPADINHMIMLNPQTWWVACDEGHIALTTDGGSTWTIQQTGQGGYFLVGIDAWDSQLALAVGTSESLPKNVPILKTSNGGTNWEVKQTFNADLNKVTFIKD